LIALNWLRDQVYQHSQKTGKNSCPQHDNYHPKFEVDDMVLAELMDMQIPFCSE
jgi:hypothetical protein